MTAVDLERSRFTPPAPTRATEVGPPEEVDLERHPMAAVALALGVLLLIIVAFGGFLAVLNANSPGGTTPRIVLPSVALLPVDQAQQQLDALGIVAAIEYTPNSLVPVGVVFAQEPRSGAKVAPGTEVVLVVSDGPAGTVVPEVLGVQAPLAASLLGRLGLSTERQDVPDDLVRPGEVIATVPAAGSPAPSDRPVVLRVSSGPAPRIVPSVVGQPVGPGMSAVGRAGLGLGSVETEVRAGVEPGVILSLSPEPGTALPPGTRVAVVVSGQPELPTVPSLVGLTRRTAEEVAGDAVTLRIRTRRLPAGDVLVGRVVEQSLPVGTPVEPGTPLELIVGES